MNIFRFVNRAVLLFALISAPVFAFADEATTTTDTLQTTPQASSPSLSDSATVDVPANCSVTDTDGVMHNYSASKPSAYLAICALSAALQNGSLTNAQLSNAFPDFGLFVIGLNGVSADPNRQYWALYQNGGFAANGLTTLEVAAGDTLTLSLHDFSDVEQGAQVTLTVRSLIATTSATTNVDTTPPNITPPADQTVFVSSFPTTPILTLATATDTEDANPTVTYSPTSFLLGTTTVTWTATDSAGNTATTTSNIGVFLNANASVNVPAICEATDTDGVMHNYSASKPSAYLAICALSAALQNGSLTNAQLSNAFPDFGLFVIGLNGVSADPNRQYWALYQNGGFAANGLTTLEVAAGDTVTLSLHNFLDIDQGAQVTLSINSLIATSTLVATTTPDTTSNTGGGGGGSSTKLKFNQSNALAYLISKQKSSGSFSTPMLSDWAALALPAAGGGTAQINLASFLKSSNPSLEAITDYERHAMALMALGINPYTANGDYITPIVRAFDGTQIGDVHLDNDDIFALFPLLHAGYSASDTIIQKTAAFIVSAQVSNGSWDNSVDMTAAAIQSLSQVQSLPGVTNAITRAKNYLQSKQQSTGGFENSSFSTSWAIQGIVALGDSPTSWTSGTLTPDDYLTSLQQSDGGVELVTSDEDTRIWATEYALVAEARKTWGQLLGSFAKPTITPSSSGTDPLSPATTTLAIATSTGATATSTLTVVPLVGPKKTLELTSPLPHPPALAPKTKPLPQPITTSTPPATSTNFQVAAVAEAGNGNPIAGFFMGMVHAVISFFSNIL